MIVRPLLLRASLSVVTATLWLKKRSVHAQLHLHGSGASADSFLFSTGAMMSPEQFHSFMQMQAAAQEANTARLVEISRALLAAGGGGGIAGEDGRGGGHGRRAAIDKKAIRIRDFDGSPSGWDQWVHAFKSAMRCANPGVLEFMNEAEKMTTEAKDDNLDSTMAEEEVKKMSGELYNILSQYCTGEALTVVRGVTTFEGLCRGSDCTRSSARKQWPVPSG